MSKRTSWETSSSNLRLCLKLFAIHDLAWGTGVAQFEWIILNNSYYLYNHRSQLILASVTRQPGSKTMFFRYRNHTRYRSILAGWAESVAIQTGFQRVVLCSHNVSRWERRVNRSGSGTLGRERALELLHQDKPIRIRDGRRRLRTVTVGPLQRGEGIVFDETVEQTTYESLMRTAYHTVTIPDALRDRINQAMPAWYPAETEVAEESETDNF